MQKIFPNAELVIKLQTSPMTQMSVAIYPAISGDIPRYKDTKKNLLVRERYQEALRRGKSIFITRVI